jgi:hypothetical protein
MGNSIVKSFQRHYISYLYIRKIGIVSSGEHLEE